MVDADRRVPEDIQKLGRERRHDDPVRDRQQHVAIRLPLREAHREPRGALAARQRVDARAHLLAIRARR